MIIFCCGCDSEPECYPDFLEALERFRQTAGKDKPKEPQEADEKK